MADWWMDDDQIASDYRCAADRIEQIKIFGQLFSATKKEVLNKLLQLGSIDEEKYEELLTAIGNRRVISKRENDVRMQLYKSGYSDRAIGEFVGTSKAAIKNWREREGLKANNPSLGINGIWQYSNKVVKNETEVKR